MCHCETVEMRKSGPRLAPFSCPSSYLAHLPRRLHGKTHGDENISQRDQASKDVPVLRVNYSAFQAILFGVWEVIQRSSTGPERREARMNKRFEKNRRK